MDNKDIFTVTVTGANSEVRSFISDCVIVIAHNMDDSENFNMSLNNSSTVATTIMLIEALDRAKQQILDSNPRLKAAYEFAVNAGGDGDA